jgi:hypothetical protein
MDHIYPDIAWYSSISTEKASLPHCPYANVYRCSRYYQSISLLGNAGITTKIDKDVDDNLLEYWKRTEFWPVVGEEFVSISGSGEEKKHFSNFCPEVAYSTFGLFASHLSKYADDIDKGIAEKWLANHGRSFAEDWRWNWSYVEPLHYLQCHLYTLLESSNQYIGERAMFKRFLTDIVNIHKEDGRKFNKIKACVQTNVILIDDVSIPIEIGDMIARQLPSGVEEVYVVDDPGYQAGLGPVKAHYQIKAHRKGSEKSQSAAKTITYNISGNHTKVNINSQDFSTNITNAAPEAIFTELRNLLEKNISDEKERLALLNGAGELQKSIGSKTFAEKYKQFIMLAANHMTLIAPFIPALTQYLSS